MKNMLVVFLIVGLLFVQNLYTQTEGTILSPKVDERVELLSIVFKLANNPEYNMSNFKKYTSDIDNHFRNFKDHPAVKFAKELGDDNGVSYDAVMSMAIHLSPPPELKPLVGFSDIVPEKRWGKKNALKFAAMLQDFYKDTHFEKFFEDHQDLYHIAEKRFSSITQNVDLNWYQQFYGEKPKGDFNLLIGMNNGGGNYGVKIIFSDGKEKMYSIIGISEVDNTDLPRFNLYSISTIIHEFNHSFINPEVNIHFEKFSDAADDIFKPISAQMKSMAYASSKTTIIESLVRAAVIIYYRAHPTESISINKRIIIERSNGFVWEDELFSLLVDYENNRKQYPTFDSYMPVIGKFLNELAPRIKAKIRSFDSSCANVISIEPLENKSQNVDTSLTEINIHFDKVMNPKRHAFNYGNGGKEHYPVDGTPVFEENGLSLKLKLQLKPEWEYSFALTSMGFESLDGYPLKKYIVEFRTNK